MFRRKSGFFCQLRNMDSISEIILYSQYGRLYSGCVAFISGFFGDKNIIDVSNVPDL